MGFLRTLLLMLPLGCAAPAIGRGGDVFEVVVHSVNGRQTAARGSVAHPAITLQVGDTVARVWLASQPPSAPESPVVLRADAEALKAGMMLETGWMNATIHDVTDQELAVGAAMIYVPAPSGPAEVELRFRRTPRVAMH